MEPTIATILLFGGNFEPLGWAFCNGQIMSIAQNTALFSLVGTTYGGNGQTTFALPDLRGRMAVGTGVPPGRSPYDLGQVSGAETATLTQAQMPAHSHPSSMTASVGVTNSGANSDEPDGTLLTTTGSAFYATGGSTGHLGGVTATVAVNSTGNNLPVSIMPPYLVLNYIIALEGIYPSRN
jgi:microcystin-dependent protein